MKFYLRLMLLLPLLRLMMCLDEEDVYGPIKIDEPDYTELDELVTLHARAILHMNKLGWPIGGVHRILVDYEKVRGTHWWSRTKLVPVYKNMFGVTAFAGFYIMRSGAIYYDQPFHYDSQTKQPQQLLDLALIDDMTRHYLVEAFEYILELSPEPVYIT